MTFSELRVLLTSHFGDEIILRAEESALQPALVVPAERIAEVCGFLHEHEATYFDFLSCLTAIDNGPAKGIMEVIYHLYSIPYEHSLVLKITVPRNREGEPLPEVPTISHIWRTADWHEREAYDLVGIRFRNHSDLRRILCAADWVGHPLRKDYRQQDTYHGIKVAY